MIFRKKLFWIIGSIFAIISFFIIKFFFVYENQACKNVENCEKIHIGLTIREVIEIMGNPDNIITYKGKINYNDMEIIRYYYNAPSGASVGVEIFFNVQTKQVVRIECKD